MHAICSKVKTVPTSNAQPAFTCSNLTIETLEQGVKCFIVNYKHIIAGWVKTYCSHLPYALAQNKKVSNTIPYRWSHRCFPWC